MYVPVSTSSRFKSAVTQTHLLVQTTTVWGIFFASDWAVVALILLDTRWPVYEAIS